MITERCCFVCGRSSTNPALLESDEPERFQTQALPDGMVQCLMAIGQLVKSYGLCTRFIHRNDFEGWPMLPPSIFLADRHRDIVGR